MELKKSENGWWIISRTIDYILSKNDKRNKKSVSKQNGTLFSILVILILLLFSNGFISF